jgi:hypothetical protein
VEAASIRKCKVEEIALPRRNSNSSKARKSQTNNDDKRQRWSCASNCNRHAQKRRRNRRASLIVGDGLPSGRVVLTLEQLFQLFL